jgi:multicomponent Na+:H+ antiporter subunit G
VNLNDLLVFLLALTGVGFLGITALGLLRLPDLYTRMHAVAKPSTLGLSTLVLAAAIHDGHVLQIAKMLTLMVFFFLTTPVTIHLMARAASSTGLKPLEISAPLESAKADFVDEQQIEEQIV